MNLHELKNATRTREAWEPKTIQQAYTGLNGSFKFTGYIMQLISLFTSFYVILYTLQKIIEGYYTPIALTIILTAAIEILKRATLPTLAGEIVTGLCFVKRRRIFATLAGATAAAVVAVSIITSIYGGAYIAIERSYIQDDSAGAIEEKIKMYEEQAAAILTDKKYKNSNGETLYKHIKEREKITTFIIPELLKEKQQATAAAITANAGSAEAATATAKIYSYLIVVCECVFIISVFFCEYFNYSVWETEQEQLKHPETVKSHTGKEIPYTTAKKYLKTYGARPGEHNKKITEYYKNLLT